jgi:DNA-binding NarL/FixJ family response regulator
VEEWRSVPADPRISVLLADDHALVRRGFRRILEDDPSIVVVGEASDGREAVELVQRLAPRVVVMDCAMPGATGLEALHTILQLAPRTAVIMLSMHDEDTLVRQALDAGARGYLLKSALELDLADAVKRAASGEQVVDPALGRPRDHVLKGDRASALTARELEVLRLICAGRSNREIAAELHLSVNTVSVHRANIMSALGLHKTAELVTYAIRHGLVALP